MDSKMKELRTVLTLFIEATGKMFDVKLDYSPQSIIKLEEIVNKAYPLGHKPMLSTLVMFGLYLGETIVKNVDGAEWQGVTQDPNEMEIKVGHKLGKFQLSLFPIKRARKFWFDRTDGLYAIYNMCKDVGNGEFFVHSNNEWVNTDNNYKYRFTEAKDNMPH